MEIVDKKAKRKEDVRSLILNAAKKLFVEEGYHATSIRKIASEIGYSPTTIYLYYTDKNDIVYALSEEGFTMLKTQFYSLQNVESPFERLKALGRTYLKFASEHPDYYQVMFMLKEPMEYLDSKSGDEHWKEGKQTFELLVSTIMECQKDGYFHGKSPVFMTLQAWALVHGLCSLFLTSRLEKLAEIKEWKESAHDLINSAFGTYVAFLEDDK